MRTSKARAISSLVVSETLRRCHRTWISKYGTCMTAKVVGVVCQTSHRWQDIFGRRPNMHRVVRDLEKCHTSLTICASAYGTTLYMPVQTPVGKSTEHPRYALIVRAVHAQDWSGLLKSAGGQPCPA